MKIHIVKTAGFCFGVKRAIDIAFKVAKEKKKGIFTLGPLIHNPQVIEQLKNKGIQPIDNLKNKEEINAIIIRTHGIPLELHKEILSKGYKMIDATCPFVKKAQFYAKLLKEQGYQVLILGEKNHPEVKSLMSYAGKDSIVVNSKIPVSRLKTKIGIVVQTTQPLDSLKKFLSEIIGYSKELKVYNTICNSTAIRLNETEKLARKVDIMFVVGGKNSANTTQLANLCKSLCINTFHIETPEEIKKDWLKGVKKVGITAGASTPDWIIKAVEKRIRDIGG